jgi:hypothetical protein
MLDPRGFDKNFDCLGERGEFGNLPLGLFVPSLGKKIKCEFCLPLKGLSHEIDFKNFDINLKILV